MAIRPSWEGHLRLSLVTCPVALYPATSEAETVRFNLINPATGNRIKMQTLDAGTGEEVSRGDLVKGYAIAKNEYVLLDKEDFERVKLESTRILDIEKFVPRDSIDRLYWDMPYHLVPSGKTGIEAFAVIRAAMQKKGMVALGRLVMSASSPATPRPRYGRGQGALCRLLLTYLSRCGLDSLPRRRVAERVAAVPLPATSATSIRTAAILPLKPPAEL